MLGLLNFRVYILIALAVAGIMLAIWNFDTAQTLAGYVRNTDATAAQALGGVVTGFVTTPIIWAMTDPLGAVVAGLLWPLAAIWFILFVALFIFSIFAPTFGAAINLP